MGDQRVKVWDVPVRLTHASWLVLVAGGIFTSERLEDRQAHGRLGLVLLALVVFRVAWGFVGSRYARFAQFVRGPARVLAAARGMLRGAPERFVGHNPVGALMVVVLLVVMAATSVTGLVLAQLPRDEGPALLRRVHASSALVLPLLILVHVGGALFSSVLEQQNLVRGMVTGWKRAPPEAVEPEPSRRARALGFGFSVAAGAAVLAWLWS